MPDRSSLEELQRQRALIAHHLAWLDAEIARAQPGAQAVAPALAASAPATRVNEPLSVPPPPAVALDDPIALAERTPPPSKLGCWLVFTSLMLAGSAGIALWIYVRYGGE